MDVHAVVRHGPVNDSGDFHGVSEAPKSINALHSMPLITISTIKRHGVSDLAERVGECRVQSKREEQGTKVEQKS